MSLSSKPKSKIETMNLRAMKVEDLIPAEYNPRADLKPGDPEYEKLKASLTEFGLVEPLVFNARTKHLISGHQRLKVLKAEGRKMVETVVLDIDEEREKALNIALNKIGGRWDYAKLAVVFKSISSNLYPLTGFERGEITQMYRKLKKDDDVDVVPDAPKKAVTERGDLILLGDHRLLCGDATNADDLKTLIEKRPAMLFTDPPYGMNLDTDFSSMVGIAKGNKYRKVEGDTVDYDPRPILEAFSNCPEVFLWGADYYAERIPRRNTGSWFVWDKTGAGVSPNTDYDKMFGSNFELCWSKAKHKRAIVPALWKGIFGLSAEDTKKRVHPTQKPYSLCSWFVERFAKEGEVVVDTYAGSGSTLIACETLKRRCFSMEIDPLYCDVIIKRWEDFTGLKAIRPKRSTPTPPKRRSKAKEGEA